MAVTVYGLRDNSQANNGSTITVKGPWNHSVSSVSDIATITSSVNVIGFLDGENRAKYFYSSAGGSVNLPTLSSVPSAVPQGAIPLGSSGTGLVYVVAQTFDGTNYSGGMLYFQVTPAAGSPDSGSPLQFSLDVYGLLLVDSATSEWL